MLAERLRSFLRPIGSSPANGSPYRHPGGRALTALPADPRRRSNGLRQFFDNLRGGSNLRILDLGGISQANVNFITLQGHKLYTEDVLRGLERLVSAAAPGSGQGLVARFLRENLNFPAGHFDGILAWDRLEFLDEEMLGAAVARLQATLRPGGTILTFFHTQAKGQTVNVHRYEILDQQTLDLRPRAARPLPRAFNNRHLERLFGGFHSVKFFLANDNLREVIVTR